MKLKKIEECEYEDSKGKRRKTDNTNSEKNLIDEAKERQIYDPRENV